MVSSWLHSHVIVLSVSCIFCIHSHIQLTPLTATSVPNEHLLEYYTQRAGGTGAGLIFSEGVLITPQGTEWPHAAGIYNDEHAEGWKKIVDAVHEKGTPIVAQLWHLGRVSHPDMEEQKKAGVPVYGPSAVAARGGKVSTYFSLQEETC
jgi:2,4-dienoyl-CoA reductase-like NADH-dependent reductase (Old Yellow Enzyme family)